MEEEAWICSSVGRITTVINRCHLCVLSNVYGKTYRYSWKCKTPCILSRSPCNKATRVLLPLALCFFAVFFHSGPDSHSKWREAPSHCLATWRIHRETRAGHRTGPASHVYLLVKDLASGPVHLRTSTNVCGEQSCHVCVQLCANCVCFKQVCQTGLFSRLWWTKSACLSVSNRIEFVWEVLMQLSRKLWALLRNCKREALAASLKKDNRF